MFVLIMDCLFELLAVLPMLIFIRLSVPNWTLVQSRVCSLVILTPRRYIVVIIIRQRNSFVSRDILCHESGPSFKKRSLNLQRESSISLIEEFDFFDPSALEFSPTLSSGEFLLSDNQSSLPSLAYSSSTTNSPLVSLPSVSQTISNIQLY